MTEITKDDAKRLYSNGSTVYVTDSNSMQHGESSPVPINQTNSDGKTFHDVMMDWYMFNHWSPTIRPRPVFLTTASDTNT